MYLQTLQYIVQKAGRVGVRIFSIFSEEVQVLVDEVKPVGSYEVIWNGRDQFGSSVASGIYLVNLQFDRKNFTRKMTILK